MDISLPNVKDTPKYVQYLAGAGVIAGIVYGMRNNMTFGKMLTYSVLLGIAGSFAGIAYNKVNPEK